MRELHRRGVENLQEIGLEVEGAIGLSFERPELNFHINQLRIMLGAARYACASWIVGRSLR